MSFHLSFSWPVGLALGLVLMAGAAHADGPDDPDTEVAKRHFEKGRAFYDAQDYRHALDEFIVAERAKAMPALDYNIARCYDRLEDYPKAIEHYQRYLAAGPNAPDAAEIRERVSSLNRRIEEQRSRPTAPSTLSPAPEQLLPPPAFNEPPARVVARPSSTATDHRRRNIGIALGVVGGAVVGTAIALGVIFGSPAAAPPTHSDYGPWTITR